MARPRGARSQDFNARRDELIDRLGARLAEPGGHLAGLRTLAESIGVTYPTLRHYFDSREGLLAALFAKRLADGQMYLQLMSRPRLPFAESIVEAAGMLASAVSQPQFMAINEIGLREGIGTIGTGSRYLERIFEPTLQAIEQRLQSHIEAGEMRRVDVRAAALSLLAPLLLGGLHQHSLEGSVLRPLALNELGTGIAEMFVRAYGLRLPNGPPPRA